MILRKSMSAFLRNLRAIPDDRLPALSAKTLTDRQYKKLEAAVFSRIARDAQTADENRKEDHTVFDAPAASVYKTSAEEIPFDEQLYERVPVDGRSVWKRNLRRYLSTALAACLCFAVLVTAVLYRRDIALYFAEHTYFIDTVVPEYVETQATDDDLPETGVAPPYENADGFRLDVTRVDTSYTGHVSLSVRLTTEEPMEGIAVQYSRVILTRWNRETEQYETLYDVYTSPQPKLDILAGKIDFPLIGLGKTNTADAEITLYGNPCEQKGIYYLVLEGLTLVRDSEDPASGDYETAMIAETLTDSTILGSFVIYPESVVEIPNPPPESTYPPHDASEKYTLSVTDTEVHYNTAKLKMRLESQNEWPLGHQIFYQICEIDLWNPEKQVWEGKFGTDESDVDFAKKLLAGDIDMGFWLGTQYEPADAALAEISYPLPDDGWYRIVLRGLILVREANEGEEAEWNLVTETLDEGAVYAVFYKG